jgi:nucleotide-binding universal stress UspA family protein
MYGSMAGHRRRVTRDWKFDMIALKNILVATDFGEAADVALRYGRRLAQVFGATLHVLHVTQNVSLAAMGTESYTTITAGLQREVDEAATKQLQDLLLDSDNSGPATRPAIRTSGSPALAIAEYAEANGIDLIAIGTHGRGGFAHIVMGSVAERVVRIAPCPVLTVRHPEHEFVLPDTLTKAARS